MRAHKQTSEKLVDRRKRKLPAVYIALFFTVAQIVPTFAAIVSSLTDSQLATIQIAESPPPQALWIDYRSRVLLYRTDLAASECGMNR